MLKRKKDEKRPEFLNLFAEIWSQHKSNSIIMKKILFLLLISAGLMASSCTKRYNAVQPNQTLLADLKTTDWATTDDGVNYSAFIKVSAIDNYVNAEDGVLVYFTFDNGTSYEAIPEVYNNISYTYAYTEGGIEVYAQSSTGTGALASAPPALSAKIVLVDSQ